MSFYKEFLVSLGLEGTKRRPRYESIFPIFKGIFSQEQWSFMWRNPDIEPGNLQEMVLFFVEILQESKRATGQDGRMGGGGLGNGAVLSSRKERPSIKVLRANALDSLATLSRGMGCGSPASSLLPGLLALSHPPFPSQVCPCKEPWHYPSQPGLFCCWLLKLKSFIVYISQRWHN